MKLKSVVSIVGLSVLVSAAPALAALPTVNSFTLAPTAVSPIPVTAFTASDSDGTVVGYMVTNTSGKPTAGDPRWTSSPWTEYATNNFGATTLYAWAKDNAGGVSNSRSATTSVVGTHVHSMSQVTGLTAALAGKADAGHVHRYGKVAIVAQSGGDYTDPAVAMSDSANWCGVPSSLNPCLLKVLPGVYDLGLGALLMQEYIDIEGSGESITVITSATSNNETYPGSTVVGKGNAEIRFLTIANTGSGPLVMGIANDYTGSPKLTNITVKVNAGSASYGVHNRAASPIMNNVTISMTGGAGSTVGVRNYGANSIMNNVAIAIAGTSASADVLGIVNEDGSSTMTNVTVNISGTSAISYACANGISAPTITNSTFSATGSGANYGIHNYGTTLVASNVTSSAKNGTVNYGLYSEASDVQIDRCVFEGATASIGNSLYDVLRVGSSKLVGSVDAGATIICVGSYNGSYSPLNAICQ